jgi:hypothetical protein
VVEAYRNRSERAGELGPDQSGDDGRESMQLQEVSWSGTSVPSQSSLPQGRTQREYLSAKALLHAKLESTDRGAAVATRVTAFWASSRGAEADPVVQSTARTGAPATAASDICRGISRCGSGHDEPAEIIVLTIVLTYARGAAGRAVRVPSRRAATIRGQEASRLPKLLIVCGMRLGVMCSLHRWQQSWRPTQWSGRRIKKVPHMACFHSDVRSRASDTYGK